MSVESMPYFSSASLKMSWLNPIVMSGRGVLICQSSNLTAVSSGGVKVCGTPCKEGVAFVDCCGCTSTFLGNHNFRWMVGLSLASRSGGNQCSEATQHSQNPTYLLFWGRRTCHHRDAPSISATVRGTRSPDFLLCSPSTSWYILMARSFTLVSCSKVMVHPVICSRLLPSITLLMMYSFAAPRAWDRNSKVLRLEFCERVEAVSSSDRECFPEPRIAFSPLDYRTIHLTDSSFLRSL